jgi:hypothetical protein
MPIYSPTGFLDITNATLRTSNLETQNLKLNGGNITVTTEFTVLHAPASNTVQFSNVTTGLVATANIDVGGELTVSGNVEVGGNVVVTGNVVAGYLYGDGSNISGISSTLQAITDNGNVTSNTIQFTNPATSLVASGNVVVTGNVTADHFVGDGSNITGISSTLQAITDSGNVTSNTIQFTNPATSLVASGNVVVDTNTLFVDSVNNRVGVGTDSPTVALDVVGDLKVSGNATITGSLEKTRALMFRQNEGSYTLSQIGYQDIVDYGAEWKASSENPLYDISIAGDYSSGGETSINFRLVVRNESTGDVLYFPDSTGWKSYVYSRYREHSYKGIMSGLGIGNMYKAKLEVTYPDPPDPPDTPTGMEVYYDGQDYSDVPSSVTDKTGNGHTGIIVGDGVGFDSTYKAFTFAGSDDYFHSTLDWSGDQVHSVSFWVKTTRNNVSQTPVFLGSAANSGWENHIDGFELTAVNNIKWYFGLNDIEYYADWAPNTWIHLAFSYIGGGSTSQFKSAYMNGIKLNVKNQPSSSTGVSFNSGDTVIRVGGGYFSTIEADFMGSIANLRIYESALNAEQIKDLYDHQKNDFLGVASNYNWEAQHGDITGTVWD